MTVQTVLSGDTRTNRRARPPSNCWRENTACCNVCSFYILWCSEDRSSVFHSTDYKRIRSISSAAFLKENVLWLLSLQRNAVEMVNETICSSRETWCRFAQLLLLSFVQDTTVFLTKQITKPKPTSFDFCFLVCLLVDSPFSHFPNRRGHRNQTWEGNALFERCSCFGDHQQSCCWARPVFQLI